MKHLILLFILVLPLTAVKAQTVNESEKQTVMVNDSTAVPAQITIPALPAPGSGILSWVFWILGLAVAIDIFGRFIPTTGKYSWITKVIGLLHDFLLFLDNTKKEPAKKASSTVTDDTIVQPDKPVKP